MNCKIVTQRGNAKDDPNIRCLNLNESVNDSFASKMFLISNANVAVVPTLHGMTCVVDDVGSVYRVEG